MDKRNLKFLVLNIIFALSLHANMEINTPDGCRLEFIQKINSKSAPILIEIHGLGSTKEEWRKFNLYLDKEKINYIAIDLRGHGKSINCNNKEIKYPNLSKKDIKNFIIDIDTVYKKAKENFNDKQIIPIGASIGANLITKYFYKKAKKMILLSPGLNYGGYEIAEYIKKANSKILFSTSLTDIYSYDSVRIFIQISQSTGKKWDLILAQKGHGVQIFDQPDGEDYIKRIIEWLKK
ncbi:MAG: alpha/beta hydrolase [Elusimicrobiota bacterium]